MSLFKTAGSLLLVCTDELLAELGGQEVAAALAGQPTGEAVWSIHVATDAEVDAALHEAVRAGGVVVKRAAPTRWASPMGSFADPYGEPIDRAAGACRGCRAGGIGGFRGRFSDQTMCEAQQDRRCHDDRDDGRR
jgi:hypothetical protein